MDARLVAKYDAPVPRYTSYPTAPHFSDRVGASTYRRWLADLPSNGTLSVYVHVPFCDSLCWFCGCHTRVVRRYETIKSYLAQVEREAGWVADTLPEDSRLAYVHFGGGSPSILRPAEILSFASAIKHRFRAGSGVALAVEIDPRDVNPEMTAAWAEAGATRASIGVQDFEPRVQQAINRIQTIECTAAGIEGLRQAGIPSINIDLLYGLPFQTVASIRRTVSEVVQLAPDRIAMFGYAHVPWMKAHQRLIPEEALPGGDERHAQYEAAATVLGEHGYVPVGLDHFAKPDDSLALAMRAGRLRRNFQGYTTDDADALLGLGVSAIGMLPAGYVQNSTDYRAYADAIGAGRSAIARGFELSEDDRIRRAVIERLMCDLRVDLSAVSAAHGEPGGYFSDELARLAPMAADGIVALDGSLVTVPEDARLFLRRVCAVFDKFLATGLGRHSRAI